MTRRPPPGSWRPRASPPSELCAGFAVSCIARIQRAVGPQVAVGRGEVRLPPGPGLPERRPVFEPGKKRRTFVPPSLRFFGRQRAVKGRHTPAVPLRKAQSGPPRFCSSSRRDQERPVPLRRPPWCSGGTAGTRSGPRRRQAAKEPFQQGKGPSAVPLRHSQLKGRRHHRIVRQVSTAPGPLRRSVGPWARSRSFLIHGPVRHGQQDALDGVGRSNSSRSSSVQPSSVRPCFRRRSAVAWTGGCRTGRSAAPPPGPALPGPCTGWPPCKRPTPGAGRRRCMESTAIEGVDLPLPDLGPLRSSPPGVQGQKCPPATRAALYARRSLPEIPGAFPPPGQKAAAQQPRCRLLVEAGTGNSPISCSRQILLKGQQGVEIHLRGQASTGSNVISGQELPRSHFVDRRGRHPSFPASCSWVRPGPAAGYG